MYATSTQKREWTYTPEKLAAMRLEINIKFREKYESVIQPDELSLFVTPEEELRMQRSIEDAALKFAEKFRPHIWPSVKWTALSFFKRAFLVWVPSDTSIRMVMMACFYLAMKIDEFYITIDDFVKNMNVGDPRQNAERILKLEPELMKVLNYNLTVHCPYRPFEGHLMDMKTRMLLLNFELESIRRDSMRFFQHALQTDVLLLYPPSQIALAAINFGLHAQGKSDEILREFLRKLIGIEEDSWSERDAHPQDLEKLEKTVMRVNQIMREVDRNYVAVTEQERENHKSQLSRMQNLMKELDSRRKAAWEAGGRIGQEPGLVLEEPVDSDDE